VSDVLEAGSNWLQEQRKAHMSCEVVYRRDLFNSAVAATVGRTVFEQDDGVGTIIRNEVRDYLIDTADLVLPKLGQVLPERGDKIEETEGSKTFIYEVVSIGSEPHWRYSDPYRKTLRIHTKHIATEVV
jgi:hypothetical protein